jgi:hypothetical protein
MTVQVLLLDDEEPCARHRLILESDPGIEAVAEAGDATSK